jgi:metallophosphoesterase superfamily enzyme
MATKKKSKKADVRPRLQGAKLANFNFFNNKESRVLVIGDLHAPFDLESYFDHCVEVYERYNCNQDVFIGDVIDNHYSSYHETDADGMGGGQELQLAIDRLARWYHRFPDAHVTVGNHDRIIIRKAQSGGVPKQWVKEYSEVLNTPNWKFVTSVEIDDVLYIHGEAGTAKTKARADMRSTVQGHLHTQAYTEYFVGANSRVFGCQVGCGIDAKSYAMAYMKVGKKPAIGCAVVLGGKTAVNELMVL